MSISTLRRKAARQGLVLHRSADWQLGPFYLTDLDRHIVVTGLDEDQVAEELEN